MTDYFVPPNSKTYSPNDVRSILERAIADEDGNVEQVLKNKHKYKGLWELYHANFLALVINKWLHRKFFLYPSDNPSNPGHPDILFTDPINGEAFPVEIMELYYFGSKRFDSDYKKTAKHIWDTKGYVQFNKCHLLIVSRIVESQFNVTKLASELKKFMWKFERIWFAIYTGDTLTWRFFEVFPWIRNADAAHISFSLKNQNDMQFYY